MIFTSESCDDNSPYHINKGRIIENSYNSFINSSELINNNFLKERLTNKIASIHCTDNVKNNQSQNNLTNIKDNSNLKINSNFCLDKYNISNNSINNNQHFKSKIFGDNDNNTLKLLSFSQKIKPNYSVDEFQNLKTNDFSSTFHSSILKKQRLSNTLSESFTNSEINNYDDTNKIKNFIINKAASPIKNSCSSKNPIPRKIKKLRKIKQNIKEKKFKKRYNFSFLFSDYERNNCHECIFIFKFRPF